MAPRPTRRSDDIHGKNYAQCKALEANRRFISHCSYEYRFEGRPRESPRGLLLAVVLLATGGCRTAMQPTSVPPSAIAPVRLAQTPRTERELALPLAVWTERRDLPEPLAVPVLSIDLQCSTLEVIAMPADDPDGDGPAQAALTDPRKLATQFQALAAVNANAFGALPDADGNTDSRWRSGQPVVIEGVAVHGGLVRSGPAKHAANDPCFWLDAAHTPHFGPWPVDARDVREAVNVWWGHLLDGGKVLPQPGGDRHPRTALGVDATGSWLCLVVVDGRQPGHSVGMTAHELATLMAQLGCARAINLDGGGSSILLAADATGTMAIINRPSGGSPRPIPLMIGVRRTSRAVPSNE